MQAPTKCDSAFPLPICALSQKSSDIASAACFSLLFQCSMMTLTSLIRGAFLIVEFDNLIYVR